MSALDDLFKNEQELAESKLPKLYDIPLDMIDDFPDHPFKVKMDEDMDQLVESIKERGLITPITLREKEDGRYEIVSGHRRRKACEIAGFSTIKADVHKDMTRDEAVILMVESNFQRSVILPSEKAFAYKMRLEAMKRQGKRTDLTSDPLGPKSGVRSNEELATSTGDSMTQIKRYIRLTNLIPDLLNLVDEGKMGMRPAVELSYLSPADQEILSNELYINDSTPSHDQAIRLRKYAETGELNPSWIDATYNMQVVTDENGKPAIQVRRNCPNLYMREISAGRGYELNPEVRTIVCNGSQTVNFSDNPNGDPLNVSVQKIDPETLNVVPGVYDFSGAQYTVYYYDTVNVSSAAQGLALLSGTPWAQMTFTAGSNGSVRIDANGFPACRATGSYMLYGTYVIRETKAPTGFNMPEDSNQCIVYVLTESGFERYISTPVSGVRPAFQVVGNDTIRATETRQIGFINFRKTLNTAAPVNGFTFGSSLNGTVYEIYVDANHNGTLEANERNANALIATVTLDANGNVKSVRYSNFNPEIGYITSRNIFELPRGFYVATETVAPECSFFGPDVAIVVDENHLVDRNTAQNHPEQISSAKIVDVHATDPYATVRFDFVLNKVAADGTRMHGATFTLYSDEACTNAICTLTEDGTTGVYRATYNFIYTPDNSTLRDGIYYYDFSSVYYLTVDVNITFSTAGMTDGTRVVVFEKIFYSAKNSNCVDGGPTEDVLIAVHEDLNDNGQTVTIHYRPSTGEVANKVAVIGVIILVSSLGILVIRKKKEA